MGVRLLSRAARRRAEPNTYKLPTGEPLRRELVKAFRVQRRAALAWARTGSTTKSWGRLSTKVEPPDSPLSWPGWDAFGLGPRSLAKRMTPLLQLVWDKAARLFAPRVGLDPDEWSVVDPNTRRMIEEAALAFSEKTLATTSLQIEDAIAKTRAELIAGVVERGESVQALTKRINNVFDQAETWRARRIAQTETSRAVHAAQEQTAIASGVVAGWKWLLSDDACPLCKTIARRAPFVRLGQPFAITSDDPHYGTVKAPPLHPHCNCTVLEVLDVEADGVAWAETLQRPRPDPEDEDDDEEPPDE